MSNELEPPTEWEWAPIPAFEADRRRRRRRRRLQWALGAAVLALTVALFGVFAWWRAQERRMVELEAQQLQMEAEHAETEARAEIERREQTERARASVRHSLVLAADARTPEEIRIARELLDETAELAKLVAPELLPEVERGRLFLADAARRPAKKAAVAPMEIDPGVPVAPPPRAVNR